MSEPKPDYGIVDLKIDTKSVAYVGTDQLVTDLMVTDLTGRDDSILVMGDGYCTLVENIGAPIRTRQVLKGLLYILMRDHLPVGDVTKIFREHLVHEDPSFTDPHLEAKAEALMNEVIV